MSWTWGASTACTGRLHAPRRRATGRMAQTERIMQGTLVGCPSTWKHEKSAARRPGDALLEPRHLLELAGDLEHACARLPGARLLLVRRREPREQAPAELVVVRLVGLHDLAVEARGL